MHSATVIQTMAQGVHRTPETCFSAALGPCPGLPPLDPSLDSGELAKHGSVRDAGFYLSCLRYAQTQWSRGLPARALLCLDRAMGADLGPESPVLEEYPMPYVSVWWILQHRPEGAFIGNPRVHFQHYAERLGPPRKDLRRLRAWACWHLARRANPAWDADPLHVVREPEISELLEGLGRLGWEKEAKILELLYAALEIDVK